jgi:heme A synthase
MDQPTGRGPLVRRIFRWLAVLTFALTAVQPVLGAFGFFRSADDLDYTAMHEMIANILFLLALALLVLTFFAGFRHRNRMLGWSVALLIAIVSQIGLGYSARDDASLLALHIPIGVAAFTFALIIMLLAFGLRFERDTT